MNVLIIGSGGRECTFAWKLAQSKQTKKLYIAPGNAGTSKYGTNLDIDTNNFEKIKEAVLAKKIDLVLVGPEDPLVNGLHDFFLADAVIKHIPVIGPQKWGAQLEGSKEFAKEFMMRNQIPTARYQSFTKANLEQGFVFLESLEPPYVLKADGLAAGKGVLILHDLKEAKRELKEMLAHEKFGRASAKVVIEEFLDGIEMSSFVLTDGENYIVLPSAKDYKRIGEGDKGLNTGGMGAVSPVSFADSTFLKKVEERIIKPTIQGLKNEGIPYVGFVFIGLIKVKEEPYVIEYNVRMGDPETEAVIPRIKSDFLDLLMAAAQQRLNKVSIETDPRTAVTVMAVSGGYPEAYEKGKEIHRLELIEDSMVFHAGTTVKNGKTVTHGGRVIALTSLGNTMQEAIEKTYRNMGKICFDKMYYRKDIGSDL